jgi:hypothetical protein
MIVGGLIEFYFRVLDTSNNPVTSGATFNTDLFLDAVTTGEVVTITHLADGVHRGTFTPLSAGTYFCAVLELAFANSKRDRHEFTFDVASAGTTFAASYANAFCAQSDIESATGSTYGAATEPSATQVAAFAQQVASALTAICFGVGKTLTPAGGSAPIDTSTTVGKNLSDMMRTANALGAAELAVIAAYRGAVPSEAMDRANLFYEQFVRYAGGVHPLTKAKVTGLICETLLAAFQNEQVSRSETHVSSGSVSAWTGPSQPAAEPGPIYDKDVRF